MATGVFVANLLRLPLRYPELQFAIEHAARGTDLTATRAA